MRSLDRILLIDDNDSTNFLNRRLIEKAGLAVDVHVAGTGEEALTYLGNCSRAVDDYSFPDLIFLDINMPRMNGWEFLEAYRENGFATRHRMIIIMLTTSLNPDDELRAGLMDEISAFVKKPVTREKLDEIVSTYFG